MKCECCTKGGASEVKTVFDSKPVRTNLCPECRNKGHFVQRCLLCAGAGREELVFDCARLAHATEFHMEALVLEGNRPEPPKPKLARMIGKLRL